MESYIVAAVALAGLYSIQNSTKKEGFKDSKLITHKYPETYKQTLNTNTNTPAKTSSTISDISHINNNSNLDNNNHISLSGNNINLDEFKHNNMVPFYGGKNTGRSYNEGQTQSILDNMVGSGSNLHTKNAQAPLFSPQDSINFTHGAPNNNDFFKERMTSVLGNKKHNEKAFVSQNIGPGLGKTSSNEGSNGFNAGIMSREDWKPKTVDELRTINNPKQTFSLNDHQGPAHSIVHNMGSHAPVKKNRVDRHFNHGPERYFTSNMNKNPMVASEHILSDGNRATTSVEYTGIPSNGAFATATKANQNFQKKIKDHIYGEIIGTPSATHPQMLNKNSESFTNVQTHRSKNNESTFYGNIQGVANMVGGLTPLLDVLKPSRKELAIDNLYKDGYISKIGAGGEVMYDPNDIPKKTLRDTSNYSISDNNIHSGGDLNTIIPQEFMFDETNRETTASEFMGAPAASTYGAKDHNIVRNQRNNNNRVTTDYTPSGNTATFNNYINMKTVSSREQDNQRNRQNVPDRVRENAPNQQLVGQIRMPNDPITDIEQRMNPDLLKAFKDNPYTHSLQNYPR